MCTRLRFRPFLPVWHLSPSDGGECTRSMHEHCQVAVLPRSTTACLNRCQIILKLTPILQKKTRYNKTKRYIYISIYLFTVLIYKYIEPLLGAVSDFKWYPDLSLLACSSFMRLSKAVLYLLPSPIQRSQVWQGMTNSPMQESGPTAR